MIEEETGERDKQTNRERRDTLHTFTHILKCSLTANSHSERHAYTRGGQHLRETHAETKKNEAKEKAEEEPK